MQALSSDLGEFDNPPPPLVAKPSAYDAGRGLTREATQLSFGSPLHVAAGPHDASHDCDRPVLDLTCT